MGIDTTLCAAFPGTGKSHYFRNSKLNVLDSDSSTFNKSEFPANYIEHIKNNMGKVDVILISSHEEVREALVENELPFTLVYPDKDLKGDYIARYKDRGSPEGFINIISNNWYNWLGELKDQRGCEKIILKQGEYISDVLPMEKEYESK